MKTTISYLVLFFISSSAFCQLTYLYTEYKSVYKNEVLHFKLEYGVNSSGYDGQVKWRLTNYTNTTFYDVSINDKKYTLSSGKVTGRLGEMMSSPLEPGKSISPWVNDYVNSDENYGTWSDKNNNPVVNVFVREPQIKFKTDKKGKSISWDMVGSVTEETTNTNSPGSNSGTSYQAPKNNITNTNAAPGSSSASSKVQGQGGTNNNLKQADEYYYSGDYGKALELYKTALNSGGVSDKYIKDRIAALSNSGVKAANIVSDKNTVEANTTKLYINSYNENSPKVNNQGKPVSNNQSKEGENIINQYEKLLGEYIVAFKNSLSGNENDLNVLLNKTEQMEQFYLKFIANENLFTEDQLERIGKIAERFANEILSLAGNISFENEEEKRKYVHARSPFIPAIQTPGAYAVDPNQNTNVSVPVQGSNSNTLPADVKVPKDQYRFTPGPPIEDRKKK